MDDQRDFLKDLVSSVCFFLLGLFLAFQSAQLPIWGKSGPEAGFFPGVISITMIGLSLWILIKSLFLVLKLREKIWRSPRKGGGSLFKIATYSLLMILFAVSIQKIGFLIGATLFLVMTLRYVERQGWKIAISFGTVSIIISHILFVYLLRVPLPRGFIHWF